MTVRDRLNTLRQYAHRRLIRLKVEYPRLFTPVVVAVIVIAMTAGVVAATAAISNAWRSQPITVTLKPLMVTSTAFNEPTEVPAGNWTEFVVTVHNPNVGDDLPGFVDSEVFLTVSGDVALNSTDVSLTYWTGDVVLQWQPQAFSVDDGRLICVLPVFAETIPAEYNVSLPLRIKFSVLGTFIIDVWAIGLIG